MKQRLVGTIVLGSLALILIPLLLDGEGVDAPPLSTSMPPAPIIDTTPLREPERPEIIADQLTSTQALPPAIVPATTAPVLVDPDLAPAPDTPADAVTGTTPETATAAAETPAIAEAEAPVPVNPEPVAAEAEPEPAAPAPAVASTSPRFDASGVPEAWTIRLGTFGERANADALQARLVLANHKAYLRPVTAGGQTLYAVYVGPVLTRAEANTLQQQLATEFQLNGVVQNFTVESPQ